MFVKIFNNNNQTKGNGNNNFNKILNLEWMKVQSCWYRLKSFSNVTHSAVNMWTGNSVKIASHKIKTVFFSAIIISLDSGFNVIIISESIFISLEF